MCCQSGRYQTHWNTTRTGDRRSHKSVLNSEWDRTLPGREELANTGYCLHQPAVSNGDEAILHPARVTSIEHVAAKYWRIRTDPNQVASIRAFGAVMIVRESKVIRIEDEPARGRNARFHESQRAPCM
jgi:hypothetical protein